MVFEISPKRLRRLQEDASAWPEVEDDDIVAEIKSAILSKIVLVAGKDVKHANIHDWYIAAALTLRDRIVYQWLKSDRATQNHGAKRVYYFSLEFLIGRLLTDALTKFANGAIPNGDRDLGIDFDELRDVEPDAALGNGGLGRLAACFMESMATLRFQPTATAFATNTGCSASIEMAGRRNFPNDWLRLGNPWEFERPDVSFRCPVSADVVDRLRQDGHGGAFWIPDETVDGHRVRYADVGWRGRHVNTLRLWSARAVDADLISMPSTAATMSARCRKWRGREAISKVLYPSDDTPAGPGIAAAAGILLRLRVAAGYSPPLSRTDGRSRLAAVPCGDSAQRHASRHRRSRTDADADGRSIDIDWNDAWAHHDGDLLATPTTRYCPRRSRPGRSSCSNGCCHGTCRSLFIDQCSISSSVRKQHFGSTTTLLGLDSLIDETGGRRVRMGHLAFVGSHSINGVSAMHTDLMRETVFRAISIASIRIASSTRPTASRFRRWLHQANPGLTSLLTVRSATPFSMNLTRLRHAGAAVRTTPSCGSSFGP